MRIDSPQLVGTTVISGTLEVTGSVGPGDPVAYDLGTYSKPWRTIFSNALSGSLTTLTDGSPYLIAGSKVGIATGSNGSVTISSTATGADFVAGSTTQVQFNASGNFGASSNFVFDNTNSWLGIGTSSPRAGLDVDGGSRFSGQAALTSNAYSGTSLQFGYQLATTSSVAIAPTTALFGANTVLSEFDMTNGSTVNAFYAVPKIIVSTAGQTLNQNGVSSAVYRSYANDLATNANMRGSTVALYMQSSLGSNTTQTAFGFNATIANNKSGHTLVAGSGVEVAGIATGPITTFTGLNVNPVTGAGTISTFYGLRLQDNAAATITTRWGISQEDVIAKNYFAGNVGIGTATFGDTFTVNGTASFTGSILPGNTISNIGSSANLWSNVYSTAFSGSLTRLSDGTSYIIAGNNVTVTTGSNGSITIDASTAGGAVSGTGTANYISKWSSSSALSDSGVYDSGTGVGIGVTSFSARLFVSGTAAAPTVVIKAGTYSQVSAVLDVQNNAGTSLFFVSGSGEIGLNQNISSVQTAAITTTTLTATTLLSVSSTIFRSAEFIVQGSDVTGTKFTTAKILAIQDGTTTSYTEYGAISLGGLAGTFSVTNPSMGTFLLQVTPTSTNSTTWKVTAILTKV